MPTPVSAPLRRTPRPRRSRIPAFFSTGSTSRPSRKSGATAASSPRASSTSPRKRWRGMRSSPPSGGGCPIPAKGAGRSRRRSRPACRPRCSPRRSTRASNRAGRRSLPIRYSRRCASPSAVTPRSPPESAATMERRDCDAIVLFGATGDLCYRKIYPALYHLLRRGLLRSEEHTSELQSLTNLVCRLLLEKKKDTNNDTVQENDQHHFDRELTRMTIDINK